MKFKVLPTMLTIMMALGLCACGKKAQEESPRPKDDVFKGAQSSELEETHKELLEAIDKNDIAKMRSLLESKSQVDLDKILENGETLMTTAVKKDLYQFAELLFENNASLFRTNSLKETPLMVAAKLGYEHLVRLLVSLGSRPDAKDINGNTALHLAILNNHEEIALYLINSRANIDITNNNDQTAFKLAESYKLNKVVDLLRSLTQSSVGLPIKIDVRNLISLGHVESLNQLFTKYPAVAHEYKDLNFYVLTMRSHPHDKALSMTHLLMAYGVDLDGPTGADVTPLIEAVKQNYDDFVALMLKENVNPNTLDDKGNSALIWSIKGNNSSIVRRLVNKNALEKYNYYENGKKKTMNACAVAKEMKKLSTSPEAKEANEDILHLLHCGLRWLI